MGWGHATRVTVLLKELLEIFPNLEITIQANKKLNFFEKILNKKIKFIKDDNLIKFYFKKNGKIDYFKTTKHFKNYDKKSKFWISRNLKDDDYDFFISDISPEGIQVAYILKKPVFGICHFTWDWFGENMKKKIVKKNVLAEWAKYQKKATKIFFPPLTPNVLYKKYPNHIKVPFLHLNNKNDINISVLKKKILFLDSGDNIYKSPFKNLINQNKNNKNIKIFHSEKLGNFKNSYIIKKKHFLTDFVRHVDYVFARPGYNTITSIIKFNKPATFIYDENNPEMKWNTKVLNKMKIFRICSINNLNKEFNLVINNKLKTKFIKNFNINKQKYNFNGQKIISNYIKRIIQ